METATHKYPHPTSVRFSAEQRDRIRHNAEMAGLSLADYIRKRTLGEIVRAKTDERVILELRRQGGLFKHAWINGQPTEHIVSEIQAAIARLGA